jgi:hypothetical protein
VACRTKAIDGDLVANACRRRHGTFLSLPSTAVFQIKLLLHRHDDGDGDDEDKPHCPLPWESCRALSVRHGRDLRLVCALLLSLDRALIRYYLLLFRNYHKNAVNVAPLIEPRVTPTSV